MIKMPDAIQKITHRIHGQRKLLVPSIMLRRGYLETAHLGQIKSEMQALQGRFFQITPIREAVERHVREVVPNYAKLTPKEYYRHRNEIMDEYGALFGSMNHRMAHLKAMKKNITQFKLN